MLENSSIIQGQNKITACFKDTLEEIMHHILNFKGFMASCT